MSVKKAPKSKTPGEQIAHQVRFDPVKFDELVFDKGYDIYHDKAMQCPCSVTGAGAPLPSCNNCLGIGWIFVKRTETRAVVQGMKVDIRFENWTKNMAGMARITTRAIDKLSFMDRIILLDVEGYYSEILKTKSNGSRKIVFTMYDILEVESIYLFVGTNIGLQELVAGADYVVNPNIPTMITLSQALSSNLDSERTLSIRYRHYQTYHVLDMNRDIVKVRTKRCSMPEEQLKSMPITGMMRKAHYLFDNAKYDQNQRLIDNDNYS